MARKVIKKITKILLYSSGVLLLLLLILYYSFRNPAFQTFASNRVAGYFSNLWGARVHVDGVDIELWKKIVLEGVFVQDQHHDTLLYAKKIKLDIDKYESDSQNVFIKNFILQNATVKLKKYKNDSSLNYQFIVDQFVSHDTTRHTSKSKWKIDIAGITLDNVRFAYRLEKDTSHVKGINFSDILASSVSGKVSDIKFDVDTIHCIIQQLSLREKSGFHLKDFYAKASISPKFMKYDELKITSNESQIQANIIFKYRTFSNFYHFNDSVMMKAQFNSSNIEMADIAYFTDELYGIRKRIFLNGDASGTVSDLKGKNIFLAVGDETSFKGNLSITGLPDIDKTFMSFDAQELRTSKNGIESIPLPPYNEKHYISVPDNISLFGVIKFKGNFSGFYNDFVAYGNFNSALGKISTDISLKEDSLDGKAEYQGKFACTDFNIGKYFSSEKYFGNITMNVNINGIGLRKDNANLTIEGKASSFECNGYSYKNIDIQGKFAKNIFDGTLSVKDENADVDFDGNLDFSKSPTHIDFNSTISKVNLSKLNFVRSDENIGVAAKISVNAVGDNLDDATGNLKLNNIVYTKGRSIFNFDSVELAMNDVAGSRILDFHSSVADAHLNGKFKPIEVASCLHDFLSNYLPSYIERIEAPLDLNKKTSHSKKFIDHLQKFSFDVQVKNTDVATSAFVPSLHITTPVSFKGNYDEEKNNFSFIGNIPDFSINRNKFNKCSITAFSKDHRLSVQASCQKLSFSDSVGVDNILLTSDIAEDTLNFDLNWHNATAKKYTGNISGFIAFSDKPKIKLKFLPSEFIIADSVWVIDPKNLAVMDSSHIVVNDLGFSCGHQFIGLEGNLSKLKEDELHLNLSSFSLSDFNIALMGTGFSLYGIISGSTSFSNLYDKPIFGSNIDIQNLKVNNEIIGNGKLSSIYESQKDRINFNGAFKNDESGNLNFSGNYFLSKNDSSIAMDASVNDMHLDFFEPFVSNLFTKIKGAASAQLKISGSLDRPLLTGVVKIKADNLHVNYLGTDYHFNGDIQIAPNYFDFTKLNVYDVNNNMADIVNGKIYHTNFKDFQLDFDINAKKFLCLNTTEKDNSLYYGKVFATGIMNASGFLDNINLTANVKTDKAKNAQNKYEYSQLYIPLFNPEEVGENSFVTFVKNDTAVKVIKPKYNVNTAWFTMDLKIEPTADAQVQLLFDQKVGDALKAKGTGNVELVLNEFGDFKMYGEYVVDNGDYLFTLKNVVNKKFKMEKGGTIRWNGNPKDADINMNAIYTLRTSIAPLFPTETADIYKKRYSVDCVMNLTGKLMAPDIKFDIQMPTVDDFVRQQALDKFNNSENDLNQQVFSLLVMNSFITPSGLSGQQTTQQTSTGASAEAVTTSEMLSSQLSSWLSQISKAFDLGVHYRPGDEINHDQVELALSTQLFNDKLMIDGSVANNANTLNSQNTSNIVGDVNANYKLTDNGKVQLKAFNKANEGDLLNIQKGPYTQGVGIMYREEFETLGEFYRKFLRKVKKDQNKQ